MLTPALSPPFPLRWGFSTKEDDPSMLPPLRLHQVHGTTLHEAMDTIQEGDGLWTQTPGLRIGVRVADCVPILLAGFAGGKPWVAALHAGWRGAVGGGGSGEHPGILRVAVSQFCVAGGNPSELAWALGPSIQKCHFEVGPEVLDAARKDPAWMEGLSQSGPSGRPLLDLHGLLKAQGQDLGLSPNLDGSIPRCTVCEPDLLWSYRRGDRECRQWGWIEIR